MPVRTEERADDLAKFGTKIRNMAMKKGLDVYEYLDVLTVSICSTLLRNELSKSHYIDIFNRYWSLLKEHIEAEECS